MSLRKFLSPVLPSFPQVKEDDEIDVLHEIPVETLYLALKKADMDLALWFFENATPAQVQGLVDIDCWLGDEFQPAHFEKFFRLFSLLEPEKLGFYMKGLDAEIIVRGLMDYIHVEDYDPQNPPDYAEDRMMLSPDNKYLLVVKTDNPGVKESLYLWLNKFSASDLELMRRHLESLKWEAASDLEEHAYLMKKGRLEEMGFVDRTEALALYAVDRAPELRKKILANPLERGAKRGLPKHTEMGMEVAESLLPQAMKESLFEEGFLQESFRAVRDPEVKEAIFLELLRTVNASLSADDLLQKDLETIFSSSRRARRYLDLGLNYLAGENAGKSAEGALLLEVHPLMQIYRLGWLVLRDMTLVAADVRKIFPAPFFHYLDEEVLLAVNGRHLELSKVELERISSKADTLVHPEASFRLGVYLSQLAQLGRYLKVELGDSLDLTKRPVAKHESAFARLITALYRQACGQAFNADLMGVEEFGKLAESFDEALVQKTAKLLVEKAPEAARPILQARLQEDLAELATLAHLGQDIDPAFVRILAWKKEDL